jgi:hypothetical protein
LNTRSGGHWCFLYSLSKMSKDLSTFPYRSLTFWRKAYRRVCEVITRSCGAEGKDQAKLFLPSLTTRTGVWFRYLKPTRKPSISSHYASTHKIFPPSATCTRSDN